MDDDEEEGCNGLWLCCRFCQIDDKSVDGGDVGLIVGADNSEMDRSWLDVSDMILGG